MTRKNTGFLFDALKHSAPYKSVLKSLPAPSKDGNGKHRELAVTGLRGSLAPLLAAALFSDSDSPLMVLCGQNSFELYENDLEALLPDEQVCNTSDGISLSLLALLDQKKPVLLSLFDDLDRHLCDPGEAGKRIFRLSVNNDAGYDNLKRFLISNDFEQREFVEDEGEYSLRGAIIDVFPFGATEPLRIEFFGDTVSSMRIFDINSQLSGKALQKADLTAGFTGTGASATLFDYIDPATIIVLDDYMEFASLDNHEKLSEALSRFRRIAIQPSSPSAVNFNSLPQKKLNANFRLLASLIRQESAEQRKTVFATASQREIRELGDFLSEEMALSENQDVPETWWVPANLYEGFTFAEIDLYTESDIFGKLHAHKTHRTRKIRGISLKDLQKLKVGDYVVHEDYGIGIFRSLETITVGNSDQESVLIEYEGGDQLYVNIQNIGLLSKYSAAESSSPALSKLGSSKWAAKKDKVRRKLRDIAINLIKVYAQRKMQPGFAFGPDSIFMREFEASFIFDETPDQYKAIEEVKKDMQASHPMDRLICGDAGFGKTEIAMRAAFKAVESKKQVAVLTPTTILAHQHYESFSRRFENFPVTIAVLSRFVTRKDQQGLLKKIEAGLVDIVIGTHRLVSKDVRFRELGLLVIDEEQHFGVEVKEKLREQFPNVDTLTMSATPIPRTLQFSMLGARDLSIVSTPPKNRQPVETVITDYDAALIESAIRREIQRDGQVFFLHNRISSIEEMLRTLHDLVPSARIVFAHGQMPPRELEKIMMDFMQKEIDVLVSTSIIGSGLDISNANTIFINRADMFGLSDLYQLRGRVGRSDRKAYCYLIAPPLHTLKREAVQRLAVIESFTELGSGFNIALRDLDIRGAGNLLGAEQSGFIHELGFDLYQKMLEETVAELKSTEFSHLFESDGKTPAAPAKSCDLVFFFNALIPDYYISATHERFAFYEKISKAPSGEAIQRISEELRDRFGPLPEEVTNLLLLSKFKLLCTALGLEKIDIQPRTLTLFLPDQESGSLARREFYQYLFTAVQEPWMQEYRPGFRFEKKMKLVLSYPPGIETPEKVIPCSMDLLKKLDAASKEEVREIS